MSERIASHRLSDIVEAIANIRSVLQGASIEQFEQDWKKRWLIERGLEIISEASRHISEDIKSRNSHIPWGKIAGIGNILRHDYNRIAADILWKVVQTDLTELEDVCQKAYAAARSQESGC